MSEYQPGIGCRCCAHSENECCCPNVDWRSTREVELEALVEKLTKERNALKTVPMKYRRMQFNAELQDEVTQLQKQLAVLAEKNEKQRAFLEFAWKDIPMNEYAFKILEHTMNLPNLATPVLNRIKAEAYREAAELVEAHHTWITNVAAGKLLRAKADELEKSK